jgi:hypothetical protein
LKSIVPSSHSIGGFEAQRPTIIALFSTVYGFISASASFIKGKASKKERTNMYKIFVDGSGGKRKPLLYTYLVGSYTVGIITPSRKRHTFPIHEVTGRPENHRIGTKDGFADDRLHPNELAAFVLKRGLK